MFAGVPLWPERDPSSHLPAVSLSSPELSEESGQPVQHGASSIPPDGCLGPVCCGVLTTVSISPPLRSTMLYAAIPLSSAAQAYSH